uniref:(northern house mosquito) hypothetical protein n=1 Tax=Culex pipiens TaxID=7175 RepID=A0A8D8HRP3_CULPI
MRFLLEHNTMKFYHIFNLCIKMLQILSPGSFPICYLRKEIKTFCSINRQKKTKLNGKALLIGVYGVVVCENASVHQINSACACGSGEIKLCLCPWDRKRRDTCCCVVICVCYCVRG